MTLLSKASIIATPTAYGDGVLNSVKPTDGDGDFTFARASSATRVNEEGLIEKQRENLYIRSQEMENAIWLKARGTVTANANAAPDGTNTADLFTEDTSNGTHDIRQEITTSSGGFYMFSIYAKANGRNVLDVYVGGANKSANFNLTTGLVTGGSAPIRKIEDVGSGWYRVSVGVIAASTLTTAIWILNNGSAQSYTGDGTSGMYFWGAQAEQSLVATDYIETTTSSVAVGITNDIPRINFENGIGNFLLEPQRRNILPHSEWFGDYDILNGASITSNYSQSPEGYQNATRLQLNAQSLSRIEYAVATGSAVENERHSVSCWVKSNGGDTDFRFKCTHAGVLDYYSSNLTATSEWQRFTFTQLFGAGGGTTITAGILNGSSNNAADLSIYGLQLEDDGAGNGSSYTTSYIPSYGSAVTRAAETCNNAGNSDLFNDSEGVLYAEVAFTKEATSGFVTISDGTDDERITIYRVGSIFPNKIQGQVRQGNVARVSFAFDTNFTDVQNKIALKYKANDFAFWVNGVEIATETSNTLIPINLDNLELAEGDGGNPFNGKVKMVSTFKEALSDSELECLTSWSSFERMATAQNYTIE